MAARSWPGERELNSEGKTGIAAVLRSGALLVWGTADRFFTVDMARRLTAAFAHGRLVEVDGGRTFLPLDDPRRVAREIAAFVREGQVADVA